MSDQQYTTTLAAQMTNLTVRQLDYWARKGIVVPSIQQSSGRGKPKIYALEDIVQLYFIAQLKRHGWSTQKIRTALLGLRDVMEDPHPLRTAIVFDGKGRMLALCKTRDGERVLLDMQDSGRQQMMWIVVEILMEEIHSAATSYLDKPALVKEISIHD